MQFYTQTMKTHLTFSRIDMGWYGWLVFRIVRPFSYSNDDDADLLVEKIRMPSQF